jgi:hypothetical protein
VFIKTLTFATVSRLNGPIPCYLAWRSCGWSAISHRSIVICSRIALTRRFSFAIGRGAEPTSRSNAICRTLCRRRSTSLFDFSHLISHLSTRAGFWLVRGHGCFYHHTLDWLYGSKRTRRLLVSVVDDQLSHIHRSAPALGHVTLVLLP